jgi:cytochrome c oxidase subunit 4
MKLLIAVFSALLVLTALTYGVALVDLGPFNIWLALGVAVVKAGLVALFFMHLRWDAPMNGFLFVVSAAFVMLFIGLALLDGSHYQDEVMPGYAPKIEAAQQAQAAELHPASPADATGVTPAATPAATPALQPAH